MLNIPSRGLNLLCSNSFDVIKNIKSKIHTYKMIILDIKKIPESSKITMNLGPYQRTLKKKIQKFVTKSTHFKKQFSRCVIFKTKLTLFEKRNII